MLSEIFGYCQSTDVIFRLVWNPQSGMESAIGGMASRRKPCMESALCAVWNPSHRDGMASAIGGMASRRKPCMESALCAVWNPPSAVCPHGFCRVWNQGFSLVWNLSHRESMLSAIGGMASRLRAFLRLPCPRLLFLLGGGL